VKVVRPACRPAQPRRFSLLANPTAEINDRKVVTVLAGSDAILGRARTMLHRLGWSVHRPGIAAAAGLVALDMMLDRFADDHRRARALAAGHAAIPGVSLRPEVIETNIVLADVNGTGIAPTALVSLLADAGLRVLERDTGRVRLVTHRPIGDDEIERAVAIVAETVARQAVPPLELPVIDDSWEAQLE